MPRDFTDGKEEPYGRIHRAESAEAMKRLSFVGFHLWHILCMNKDDFNLDLSQAAIEKEYGMKKTSYHNAFKELVAEHYLVPIKEGSNVYRFYEGGFKF